jgi:ribosomal protein S12 methylthiotransferase
VAVAAAARSTERTSRTIALLSSPPRIGFVSLGCPKALVDSERILTKLRSEGYDVVGTYADADLVVVNTCGFIDDAVHESLEAIGEALARNGKVIVTGCLGAKPETITDRHPSVLKVTGPHAYEEVVGAVHQHLPPLHDPFMDLVPPQGIRLTPRHYAYLKISEGCNHRCSFCIIPSMRGDLMSRPIGDVMGEAERLVNAGVKELLVISQDTSAYGVDLKYATGFWGGKPVKARFQELAHALGSLGAWVRLHYVYPYPHVDDVIPLMADGRVLPYLDVPFQHGSPRILRLMKRPAHAENTLERIHRWREICPDITLRSTFIVGFPGETEDDFQVLLDWLREARLDRVGCFKYSPVDGAAANALPNPVPEEVKQERHDRFMEVAAAISAGKLAAKIGRRMRVLIDAVTDDGAIARSSADAPEIDGVVRIARPGKLAAGDWADVEITAADAYDLAGKVVRQKNK